MRPLARLAVCLALVGAGCTTAPVNPDDKSKDPKAADQAKIYFDLGVGAQREGDVRTALKDFETSLQYDPNFADAENSLGILYHLSFHQTDEAEKHYKRALTLKPDYSSAKVNLAALYLDQGRYDDAIALDEEVLKDLQYKNQFLPANNEGWAWYKKGNAEKALALISETVRANPEFCQGYRNLGLIYADQKRLDLAETELDRMVKKCPDSAQGWFDLGQVQLKLAKQEDAHKSFSNCRDHAREGDPLLDSCSKLAGGSR